MFLLAPSAPFVDPGARQIPGGRISRGIGGLEARQQYNHFITTIPDQLSPDSSYSAARVIHPIRIQEKQVHRRLYKSSNSQWQSPDLQIPLSKAKDSSCSTPSSASNGHGRCDEFFQTGPITLESRQDLSTPISSSTKVTNCQSTAFQITHKL